MSRNSRLKPGHKAIQQYHAALKSYSGQRVEHEGALETAFQRLLADTAREIKGWTLIPKLHMKVGGKSIAPDGTLRDDFRLPRGYWEAKDTHDDLDAEIRKKSGKGPYKKYRLCVEAVLQAITQARLTAEIKAHDDEPLRWLQQGPGKETADSPGWSTPVKPTVNHTNNTINLLLHPEMQSLFAAILQVLTAFPEARQAVSEALASVRNPRRLNPSK